MVSLQNLIIRNLTKIIFVVVLLAWWSGHHTAFAQTVTTNPDGSVNISTPVGTPSIDVPAPDPTTNTPVGPGMTPNPGTTLDTNNLLPGQPTEVGDGGLLEALYGFVVVFFGNLVTFGAYILHLGVDNYVINFGTNFLTGGFGFVVDNTWATVRDIFNLTFIFGLIYIGFRMILFTDDAQAKRTLGTLVAAALLVNFSLFITKFIVDIANSLAVVIYGGFSSTEADGVVNIGAAFISQLGLASLLNVDPESINLGVANVGVGLAITFMTMIFFLVAAFVFAAGGILLFIRFIVLNFYMVFSPIMFLGWVFPGMAKYSTQYMSGFLRNAFMAPAYIFCLYFSYRILIGMNTTVTGSMANIVNRGNTASLEGIGSALAYFAIAMILLLASMKVAKDMGALGAGAALSIGDKTRKYTQGVVYRNTAGRAAKGALNTLDRAAYDDGKNGQRNWAHRNLNRGIQAAARSAGKYTPARTALEGAYAYGAGGSGLKATRDGYDAFDLAQGGRDAQAKFNKTLADGLSAPAGAAGDPARQAMISAVTSMSADQYSKLGAGEQKQLAKHLTSTQTENILKNDKIPESTKAAIVSARVEAIETALGSTANMDTFTDEVQNLSVDQLETMGDDFIKLHADKLTESQMDDVKKSKKFTESQKAAFITKRGDNFKNTFNAPSSPAKDAAIKRLFFKANGKPRKAKEVARLGPNVLLQKAALPSMTADVLEAILTDKTLSKNDRATLKNRIVAYSGGNKAELHGYLRSPEAVAKW